MTLADNGGPTETHALDATSAARGAGDCIAPEKSLLLRDQRGVSRTAAVACIDPFAALARTADEPAGENCPQGGTRIETGIDLDDSGSLDDFEVSSTDYACVPSA